MGLREDIQRQLELEEDRRKREKLQKAINLERRKVDLQERATQAWQRFGIEITEWESLEVHNTDLLSGRAEATLEGHSAVAVCSYGNDYCQIDGWNVYSTAEVARRLGF